VLADVATAHHVSVCQLAAALVGQVLVGCSAFKLASVAGLLGRRAGRCRLVRGSRSGRCWT